MLAGDLLSMGPAVWQNPLEPVDANGDGQVTAGDALVVANTLAQVGPGALGTLAANGPVLYVDVNGDSQLAAENFHAVVAHWEAWNLAEPSSAGGLAASVAAEGDTAVGTGVADEYGCAGWWLQRELPVAALPFGSEGVRASAEAGVAADHRDGGPVLKRDLPLDELAPRESPYGRHGVGDWAAFDRGQRGVQAAEGVANMGQTPGVLAQEETPFSALLAPGELASRAWPVASRPAAAPDVDWTMCSAGGDRAPDAGVAAPRTAAGAFLAEDLPGQHWRGWETKATPPRGGSGAVETTGGTAMAYSGSGALSGSGSDEGGGSWSYGSLVSEAGTTVSFYAVTNVLALDAAGVWQPASTSGSGGGLAMHDSSASGSTR